MTFYFTVVIANISGNIYSIYLCWRETKKYTINYIILYTRKKSNAKLHFKAFMFEFLMLSESESLKSIDNKKIYSN